MRNGSILVWEKQTNEVKTNDHFEKTYLFIYLFISNVNNEILFHQGREAQHIHTHSLTHSETHTHTPSKSYQSWSWIYWSKDWLTLDSERKQTFWNDCSAASKCASTDGISDRTTVEVMAKQWLPTENLVRFGSSRLQTPFTATAHTQHALLIATAH